MTQTNTEYPFRTSVIGGFMRRLFLVFLIVPLVACNGSVHFGVISPREFVRAVDNRPILTVHNNLSVSSADFITVESEGYILASEIRTGQTFSMPLYVSDRRHFETRNITIKGYRQEPEGGVIYVGMRCVRIHVSQDNPPEQLVVDQLIAPGERGQGCW